MLWDMATVLGLSLDFWSILTSVLGFHGSYTTSLCLSFLGNQSNQKPGCGISSTSPHSYSWEVEAGGSGI